MLTRFNGLSLLWKGVTGVLVLIAAIWAFTFVRGLLIGSQETEARLDKNQAEATVSSVVASRKIEEARDLEESEISVETKELANEILEADAGNSNSAAVRSVCGMRAYRDSLQCAGVRTPSSQEPAS